MVLDRLRSIGRFDPLVERTVMGILAPDPRQVTLRYRGRSRFAHDFDFLLQADPTIEPAVERVSHLGLVSFALAKMRQRGPARPQEILLTDIMGDPPWTRNRWPRFMTYLQATLPVCQTMEQQLEQIRSTAHRRRLRQRLRQGIRWCIADRVEQVCGFSQAMYRASALSRFGSRATCVDEAALARVWRRRGVLLLVGAPQDPESGAFLYRSPARRGTLFWWKMGLANAASLTPRQRAARHVALEAAVLQYAIERHFVSLNLGLARAVANDGIFLHKRRLGCDFQWAASAPLFRPEVPADVLFLLLRRCHLLVLGTSGLECWKGLPRRHEADVSPYLDQCVRDVGFPSLRRLRLFVPPPAAARPDLRAKAEHLSHALPFRVTLETDWPK